MGVALLWPFTTRRYFLPWQPIPVAPIGAALFSPSGLQVAAAELVLFAPLFLYALWPRRPRPASWG
jgi:inner membrane protein